MSNSDQWLREMIIGQRAAMQVRTDAALHQFDQWRKTNSRKPAMVYWCDKPRPRRGRCLVARVWGAHDGALWVEHPSGKLSAGEAQRLKITKRKYAARALPLSEVYEGGGLVLAVCHHWSMHLRAAEMEDDAGDPSRHEDILPDDGRVVAEVQQRQR